MPDIPRGALLDGSFHHHLLADRARLDAYAAAIARAVRPGDVVADIGSGSGVLAYLAAKAGASRVFAVESNTNSYKLLLRSARANGVLGAVVPVLADGTQWRPPSGSVDVVVCELMETGLLHEAIPAVMRNVAAWPAAPRTVLPRGATLLVEAAAPDEAPHGYVVRLPGFRGVAEASPMSDLVPYAAYDFGRAPPGEHVEAEVALTIARDGLVGGLQLRTTTDLAEGIALADSPAYCTPVVLALDEPIPVRAGERLRVRLAYDFDYTSEPLRFDVARE